MNRTRDLYRSNALYREQHNLKIKFRSKVDFAKQLIEKAQNSQPTKPKEYYVNAMEALLLGRGIDPKLLSNVRKILSKEYRTDYKCSVYAQALKEYYYETIREWYHEARKESENTNRKRRN